jgi:hypothetical protein
VCLIGWVVYMIITFMILTPLFIGRAMMSY